jgi:hypothetical protein
LSFDATLKREAERAAQVLQDLNVDTYESADLRGQDIAQAILAAVRAADFVCLVLAERAPSPNVGFEAGLAAGLGKPVLALTFGKTVPFQVTSGVQIIRFKDEDVSSALQDIRRFLRHVRPRRDEPQPTGTIDAQRIAVANTLERLRQANSPGEREAGLISAVADLFERQGSEVLREDEKAKEGRPDLLVWSDPLSTDLGGPVIIECKYYKGGSGSVLANARNELGQLANYVERSHAKLGLLVFDHDRPTDLKLTEQDTPKALAFYIGDLVAAVASGTLTDEIWRRQARASRIHRGNEG